MLNNKLSGVSPNVLRELPYEQKAQMFDDNCKGCPYQRYYTMLRDNYKIRTLTYEQARIMTIHSESNVNTNLGIIRMCAFSDEKEFSLTEIIMNTCQFWMKEPADNGEEFREVTEKQDMLRMVVSSLLCLEIEIGKKLKE